MRVKTHRHNPKERKEEPPTFDIQWQCRLPMGPCGAQGNLRVSRRKGTHGLSRQSASFTRRPQEQPQNTGTQRFRGSTGDWERKGRKDPEDSTSYGESKGRKGPEDATGYGESKARQYVHCRIHVHLARTLLKASQQQAHTSQTSGCVFPEIFSRLCCFGEMCFVPFVD